MSLGLEGGRGTPAIDVQFTAPGRRYVPGGAFAARYRIGGVDPESVRALELSVAWYTEGKGEEDLVVHAFERVVDRSALRDAFEGRVLEATLPPSPLSYEGIIVKIRWCVRIRVFSAGSRDFVSEHVFDVGAVPPARAVAVEDVP